MKKTFAQRARELEKKYKRAKYDPVEKEELAAELRKLRDEQEAFRADADVDDDTSVDHMPDGGTINPFGLSNITGIPYGSTGVPSMGPLAPIMPTGNKYNNLFAAAPTSGSGDEYGSIKSSIVPSLISTGVSLAGNIAGMIGAKKNAKTAGINIPRVAPEQISLEPQRESLRREAGTARNVMLRNARDVSSPGAAYANQIAGIGSIYDSLGSQSGQSYMTEQNTNAQMRQSANQSNLESELRGSMFNAQMKDKYNTEASAYRDAAFQAIPEGLRDYRAQRSQDQWMSTMGKDYGLYQKTNPNATFKEKLLNSLFGNEYGVYNREYMNFLNR